MALAEAAGSVLLNCAVATMAIPRAESYRVCIFTVTETVTNALTQLPQNLKGSVKRPPAPLPPLLRVTPRSGAGPFLPASFELGGGGGDGTGGGTECLIELRSCVNKNAKLATTSSTMQPLTHSHPNQLQLPAWVPPCLGWPKKWRGQHSGCPLRDGRWRRHWRMQRHVCALLISTVVPIMVTSRWKLRECVKLNNVQGEVALPQLWSSTRYSPSPPPVSPPHGPARRGPP